MSEPQRYKVENEFGKTLMYGSVEEIKHAYRLSWAAALRIPKEVELQGVCELRHLRVRQYIE